MAFHTSENATLIIPRHQWTDLKRTLREAYNAGLERDRQTLRRLRDTLKQQGQGWRRFNYEEALDVALDQPCWTFTVLTPEAIPALLLSKGRNGLLQPRCVLKTHLTWASRQTRQFPAGPHGTIRLSADSAHQLRWQVDSAPGSLDAAYASCTGQALFALLPDLAWTRGSGGVVTGASRSAPEYPAWQVRHFGPVGELALLARLQSLPASPHLL